MDLMNIFAQNLHKTLGKIGCALRANADELMRKMLDIWSSSDMFDVK